MNKRISKLLNIFPTPVWWGILEDHNNLNTIMKDYILGLRSSNPAGISKSNHLGWHSEDFHLNDQAPKKFLDNIKPMIKEAIDDMSWDLNSVDSKITNMWSIINKKNSSNLRHIHPNCFLSSAYYVYAPKNCGKLTFHDPRSAAVYRTVKTIENKDINSNSYNIVPQSGMLVLFPSYLHHSVAVNESEDERIVISFNVDFVNKN